MTGRRAIVALSLLCALVVCAFAAPNASALKGTTAYTCEPEPDPTDKTAGFEDEHCTKAVTGTKAKWVHKEIPETTFTFVTATNNETAAKTVPAKFKTTVGGEVFEAEATAFQTCAGNKTYLINLTNFIKQMWVSGRYCGEFTKVTVTKPAKCSVAGGAIKTEENGFWGTEVLVNKAGKEEMYVEFKPPVPKVPEEKTRFALFEIIGEECPLKNKKVEVTGAARANVSTAATLDGATLKFTTADTGLTLKVGAEKAEFSGTFTPRMSEEVAGEELNPITLTTTPN